MRGHDPPDRLHECREPFAGAHCRSRHGVLHSVRTGSKPRAHLATVADRMCVAIVSCVRGGASHRVLDCVGGGKASACPPRLASLLHAGWSRAGVCHRRLNSQRFAFRRPAVDIREPGSDAGNPRVERHSGRAADSRNVGRGTGDADHHSSYRVDRGRPGIRPPDAHRSGI